MRIYKMIDEELQLDLGYIEYFEKENSYIIELFDYLDEWTAPLLFAKNVIEKNFTILREQALAFIKERTIPNTRQNISDILSNSKLKEYNEMKLLDITKGRCSQDNIYFVEEATIPQMIESRLGKTLIDCVMLDNFIVLCFFADETIRKIDFSEYADNSDIKKIISNRDLFESGKVSTGGYILTFNESIDIPASFLYDKGVLIPLKPSDFGRFIEGNVLDTSDACDILECSRQNLSYLIAKGALQPFKVNVKGNLYLKGNVLKNKW